VTSCKRFPEKKLPYSEANLKLPHILKGFEVNNLKLIESFEVNNFKNQERLTGYKLYRKKSGKRKN